MKLYSHQKIVILFIVMSIVFTVAMYYKSEQEVEATSSKVYPLFNYIRTTTTAIESIHLTGENDFKIEKVMVTNSRLSQSSQYIFKSALDTIAPSIVVETRSSLAKFNDSDILKDNFHTIGYVSTSTFIIISSINPKDLKDVMKDRIERGKSFSLSGSKRYHVHGYPDAQPPYLLGLQRFLKSIGGSNVPKVSIFNDITGKRIQNVRDGKVDFAYLYGWSEENPDLYNYMDINDLINEKLFIYMRIGNYPKKDKWSVFLDKAEPILADDMMLLESIWLRNDFPTEQESLLVKQLKGYTYHKSKSSSVRSIDSLKDIPNNYYVKLKQLFLDQL